ncbi:nucleic acid-binding domain protein [Gleimia coleocanis DSM 15436]|uniref:Nucleic acid-binding domain protein n=1 Tax=Gleimia coleocanis DSM 15436 TaxID=525245 RepID=C0W1S7_9ACTO|nr:OB-fold nucleic acid binding domain-containing protein [Gleimia coleocanis]EEH63443.1 nucleic acid-binding domain protein [Gleimia coleocanis DSM 15436]
MNKPIKISKCADRSICTVEARVASITFSARSESPYVKATLRDDSGSLLITWLGRKVIGGVAVGETIQVTGMVSLGTGYPQMINPRYQLLKENPQEIFLD